MVHQSNQTNNVSIWVEQEKVYLNKLYNEIITTTNPKKTFQDNIELCKFFYENRDIIIEHHLLEDKLFTIIKFLIREEQGQIFEYFESNLLDSLSPKQQYFCFKLRNKNPKEPNDIDSLFNNLNHYEDLCKFLKNTPSSNDFITKNSIQKYQTMELPRDTIEALILNLHANFFQLPSDVVRKLTDYISKSPSLVPSNDKLKIKEKNMQYNNLIFQYLIYLLPIKEFLGENIKEDRIIKEIKKGTLKNKKVIDTLFKTLSIENTMSIFHDDIHQFFDWLDKIDSLDEQDKQEKVNQICDYLLNPDYFYHLLPPIVENNGNKFWKNYLTKNNFEKIINYTLGIAPNELDYQTIKYLLEKDYINELFMSNLYQALRYDKEFLTQEESRDIQTLLDAKLSKKNLGNYEELNQLEIKEEDPIRIKILKAQKYNLIGKRIDFPLAITFLKKYLNKEIKLGSQSIQIIVKSIIHKMLESINVEHHGVYFVNHQKYNGSFNEHLKIIDINTTLITNLLKSEKPMQERLHIFITAFHEMEHAKKTNDFLKENYDFETYEMQKENELIKYDKTYYRKNYKNTKQETDARIAGHNMLSIFIETYLPDYLDYIQDTIIEDLKKEYDLKQRKTSNVAIIGKEEIQFSKAFDTLVKYNPKIIKENKIFELEYHENGIPKNEQEILIQKTEENAKLIDDIIEARKNQKQDETINQLTIEAENQLDISTQKRPSFH